MYQTCCAVWTGDPLNRGEWIPVSMLFKIRHHLVTIDEESCLKRGTGRREHQYCQFRADKDYTRFSFFSRTVIQWNQLQVISAWQSRSTPSRLRSRRSSTQDSINLKNTFYLFVFLHLFFLLSFSVLSVPTHLFHSSIFSVSHSTGDNPQS